MIELVVCDLDGTLINSDLVGHKLSKEIIDLVKVLKERGIYFTIATGRETMAAKSIVEELELNCPYITFNGAQLTETDGTNIYGSYVNLGKWMNVIKEVDRIGGQVVVCEEDTAYALRLNERIRIFENKQKIKCDKIEIRNIPKIKTSKLLLLGDINRFKDIISKDHYLINNFELIQSEDDYLEIVNKGINKGEMVKELIRQMDIKGEVLSIGNHMNDLELLQAADIGVAVANATEELKSYADYITKGQFEQGVIETIKKFVL